MNSLMAEKMLKQESHFDYKSMRKSMEKYDSIKKTMYNNKKKNHSNFLLPPANINVENSKVNVKVEEKKKMPMIRY